MIEHFIILFVDVYKMKMKDEHLFISACLTKIPPPGTVRGDLDRCCFVIFYFNFLLRISQIFWGSSEEK